jgi:hypothetical protein
VKRGNSLDAQECAIPSRTSKRAVERRRRSKRRGGEARADGEVAKAESSGSTKPRRCGVRTHPCRPEMLIILSSFFTIYFSQSIFVVVKQTKVKTLTMIAL